MAELPNSHMPSLACIDLSNPDLDNLAYLVKQASLDSGFFYVVNHGISEDLFEEVFGQSKKFFSLPQEEKMKVLRNKSHKGYTPFLDETLDPENQIKGDYKEGYYIGLKVAEDDPRAERQFHGQNVWPSAELLPGWRETMEKYHQEALKVARRIAKLIALALDLDAEFFNKPEMLDEPIATLRLLHYAGEASNPELGIYGAGAHTDYGLMTLLATDSVPGLQICKNKDAYPQIWEDVTPLKGGFIVNLGDMLERWSNDIFRTHKLVGSKENEGTTNWSLRSMKILWSTMHRVVGTGQERYSIAYFVEPSHDCVVECLRTCHSETNPPKYPPIKCEAYLAQRYKDTHKDLQAYTQSSEASET